MDATVRLWDYRSGEELSRVTAREPVKYMVIHKDLGVAYLSMQLREGGGRVVLYNIRSGKFSGTAMKTRLAGPLALSPAGGLAATIDRHSLFVWRTGTDIYQPLNLHHTKPYTCLAISADDSLIAAGDASGRILIWRAFEHSVPSGLRSENSGKAHPAVQPPLTTLHWHAHPVGCLTFSPDGTYLLSGGSEGVLVQWALETNRPGFLPRLGGPLLGLHPSPADPARYLVRQADNVVRLVNVATMKVECSVQGLRPSPLGLLPPAGVAGGAAALLPPGAGGAAVGGGAGSGGVLVVPAENAALQFYDVGRDRHMQLVQVAPRNAVSLSDASTSGRQGAGPHPPHGQQHPHGQHHTHHSQHHQHHPHAHVPHGGTQQPGQAAGSAPGSETPAPPFVSLLAFSRDGSVMATVDLRPDAGPYGSTEACLKFWDAGSGSDGAVSTSGSGSGFVLNTRVDEPHRDLVSALVYHPTRNLAVTTGGSGSESEYKVWIQERRASAPGSGSGRRGAPPSTHWRCLSTGGYKGLPLGAAAFSADGSVLAVAAGSRVTLWDAESNALAAALPAAVPTNSAAAAAAPLTSLAFVPNTPFLAAASPSCVAVYNLLTAAVHWCLPYGAVSITADAAYGLLAAALPAPPPPQAAVAAAAAEGGAGGEEAAAAEEQEAAGAGPSSTAAAAAAAAAQRRRQAARAAHGAAAAAGCHVLVFDPRDATPKYHCHVPGASHVHLAALPSAAAGGSGSGGSAGGCSPLLILRDNRQYSVAAVPGSGIASASAGEEAAAGPIPKEETLSVFEATFGKVAAGGTAGGAVAMDVDGGAGVGGKARWAELFDAPSHVLPPPTALAHAFLTLLTTTPGDS
ncbi:hypothetical protein HYH02_006674 [Chlamydomonas schloesseri]|uniref:WD repeat-containing protein 75 second beta-propeller domain-containing protein n=1 Tax=Chlamydomonas schloesseri TaxID=2026947 RepID=A0A835W0N6_9CHLO|nr:hypothetical protein HYH02_006674 [Chlamydomonas schloesseri]|eukprot:KAG2432689.1 hypothetical protein HYH02_006674 [Chlamydomonas schloesseri]